MLRIRSGQAEEVARVIFAERLQAALLKDVPHFGDIFDETHRKQFVKEAVEIGKEVGLVTEQGIVSYALAILWVGPDFETKSMELERILKSNLPEVRKVHAINEWVNAMFADPDNIAGADARLRDALKVTEPWGN